MTDTLREPPEECVRAARNAERRDGRFFKRNPDKLEYKRPYLYGEFWPLHLPDGTMVRVVKITKDSAPIRHALTDNPVPFPGYEEEAEFFRSAVQHLTNDEFNVIIRKARDHNE